MITHYILICSSYALGKRVALDYCYEGSIDENEIATAKKYIYEVYGEDAPFSIHCLKTNSKRWDSVVELDPFFDNVQITKSKEEFAKIIKKDSKLIGLDVAKYILTKVPCTHKKLEKLVYFCYADYLCKNNERLFEDTIYAYQFGPAIKSVYKVYKKKSGLFKIKQEEDDEQEYDNQRLLLPIRSRIISSINGTKKAFSIDRVLDKYGKLTTSDLVELTHRENTPWKHAGANTKKNQIITDDMILTYHKYEELQTM